MRSTSGTPDGTGVVPAGASNIQAIGALLYGKYLFLFEAAGIILLVAMIGAIVLTHRQRTDVRVRRTFRSRSPGDRATRQSTRGPKWARVSGCEGDLAVIGIEHYVVVSSILFVLGVLGIFLNRKNVIVILMAIELILLAVNINFVAFSAYLGDLTGQIFAMFVLTVAAGEAAIGLAILVIYFRGRGTIAVDDINRMKG